MNLCFRYTDLLLPSMQACKNWAVIACDQHTSDPDYWRQVRSQVGDSPSALSVILPEAELSQMCQERIDQINDTMTQYLASPLFHSYPDSFVYVERELQDGSIRQGVVGVIDLERYEIPPCENTKVFATEQTVPERLPPRIQIRKDATLELSHVVLFCDDPQERLIEPIGRQTDALEKLYDFDLMTGGGHITGWLLSREKAEDFLHALEDYERDNIYLVGDGNHSLLTAKRCYMALKDKDPNGSWENSPARYAMVELENIHSPVMRFEPIYRVVTETDAQALIAELQRHSVPDGTPITLLSGGNSVEMKLPVGDNELVVGVLQNILDAWLQKNPGKIDYIHGKGVLTELAQIENSVGILLPDFDKKMLFPFARRGIITPRKTFSIGKAAEKRYYIEGRKIR